MECSFSSLLIAFLEEMICLLTLVYVGCSSCVHQSETMFFCYFVSIPQNIQKMKEIIIANELLPCERVSIHE